MQPTNHQHYSSKARKILFGSSGEQHNNLDRDAKLHVNATATTAASTPVAVTTSKKSFDVLGLTSREMKHFHLWPKAYQVLGAWQRGNSSSSSAHARRSEEQDSSSTPRRKRSFKLWHMETLTSPFAPGVRTIPEQLPVVSSQSQVRLHLYMDAMAGTLYATVLEGRESSPREDHAGLKVYIKLYVVPDPSKRTKKKTSTVKMTWDERRTARCLSTVFNESFSFNIEQNLERTVARDNKAATATPPRLKSCALYVALWDAGWNRHACMGYVLIPLRTLPWGQRDGLDKWFPLQNSTSYTMLEERLVSSSDTRTMTSSSSSSSSSSSATLSEQSVGMTRRRSAPLPAKKHRYVETDLSYLDNLNDHLAAQAELLAVLSERAQERQGVLMEQEQKRIQNDAFAKTPNVLVNNSKWCVQNPLQPLTLAAPAQPWHCSHVLGRYIWRRVLGMGAGGMVIEVVRLWDKKHFALKMSPVPRPVSSEREKPQFGRVASSSVVYEREQQQETRSTHHRSEADYGYDRVFTREQAVVRAPHSREEAKQLPSRRQLYDGSVVPPEHVYRLGPYSELLAVFLTNRLPHFPEFHESFKSDMKSLQYWISHELDNNEEPSQANNDAIEEVLARLRVWGNQPYGRDVQCLVTELCDMDYLDFLHRVSRRPRQHRSRSRSRRDRSSSASTCSQHSLRQQDEEDEKQQLQDLLSLRLSDKESCAGYFCYTSFCVTYALFCAKSLFGLDWNDLAFRNLLLVEVSDPRPVYSYRIKDARHGIDERWCIPRSDLLRVDGKFYTLKLTDFGVSELHGGTNFRRRPDWHYRSMYDAGVMKNASGSEDKDIIDLDGTITRTLAMLMENTHAPASLIQGKFKTADAYSSAIQKGGKAIEALWDVLLKHKYFERYRAAARNYANMLDDYTVILH